MTASIGKDGTYRHKQTGIVMSLDWETVYEVGLCGNGLTWTGSRENFESLFERVE